MKSFSRLDYVGIVVLIVGSNVPALHYALYCFPRIHFFYMSTLVGSGAVALYLVTQAKYATPAYRSIRSAVFAALGLSSVLPVIHCIFLYGHARFLFDVLGFRYVVLSGALYLFGTLLYVTHIPERFVPRTFDMIGSSHQLFHVCILIAAALHWVAMRQSYALWHAVESVGGKQGRAAVCAALIG